MNIHARILVVDDDAMLLKSTRYTLESAGYETLGAGSGEEALQLVRANKPDLVLLDVNMPGMDGIEVCRRIKTEPGMPGTYILLLSGNRTDSDSQADGLETGADGFIVRPVTNRELLARLEALLRLKAAQSALRLSEEQYRGLYENATFGIYRTTPDGRIIMANPALVSMLGYQTSEELVQRDLTSEGYEPAYLRQEFQRRIEEDGKISGLVSAWKRKDGSLNLVRESARLMRDENNQPLYYEGMVEDVTEQKQSEKLQDAIYRIAQAADQTGSLDSLYPSIHAIIKEVMVADNFYIALYDKENDLLSFPYSIDEVDPLVAPQKLGNGLTAYVLRTAKSLLCDDARFEDLVKRREVGLVGVASPIWLGVPLMIAGKAIGVMAVQDYQDPQAYGEREQRVLEFVSSQVASAIHRKRKEKALAESESSLQAILGSTADGILAVDHENNVLYTNERFMEMWRIPQAVRSSKDDAVLLQHVLDQLDDPQGFLHKVQELYKSEEESFDTLLFKDGRAFERGSRPLMQDLELQGRVWSFRDITERKQSEKLQDAIYRIAQATDQAENLDSLYLSIYAIIKEVMVADNFYIALYDKENDLLSFHYLSEEVDPPDAPKKLGKGLTEYVLRTAKPLLCDDALFESLKQRREVELVGAPSAVWLGVPLMIAGKAIGVMAVQDYKDPRAYGEREQRILEFVSSQAAMAIHRKRAEQMLKTSEKRFRDIADNTQEWIWEVDVDGKYTYASPVVEKILGYAPDKILHKYFFDLFLPEDRESLKEAAFAAFASKQPFREFYNRNVHKNGQTVWLSTSGLPMFDTQGNLLGYRGVDSDITERKRSEDALKQSEAQYRLLADNMSDTIWLMDLNLKLTYVSPSVEKIRGYTLAELQQFTLDQLFTPASFQAAMELFALEMPKVIADPTYSPTHTLELEFYKKDGAIHSVETKMTIVRDGNGNPVSLLGQDRDITERKRAEEQIRQLNVELEQRVEDRTRELRAAQEKLVRQEKLAVLGQLAGSVGHELRNPLNVINNAVYFLKLVQPDADDKIRKYHAMIEQEVRNSDKIITDLLDFARIKSVDRESVAVPELVQRVLARFPVPAAVQVALKLPATLPTVFTDPRQMEQVLGNLTVNACQAMPQGGRLTISSGRKKDFVSIAVKDTGVGITPENMQKLFEPLFTTKIKGIGLGLAVSRKLAEANGGRIEVQSEPGQGSTFTLYLPVSS